MMLQEPVRLGLLGCAKINQLAIFEPIRNGAPAIVGAIASRDRTRAEAYAREHGVASAYGSYEALLEDDQVEAVYLGLPNALHCEWAVRALRAGKAVLCEKPFASNAEEAERMAAVARETGLPLVEARHWRHHPLAVRLKAVLDSDRLGKVRSVEVRFMLPRSLLAADNIRLSYDLSGGAVMDQGCYGLDFLQFIGMGHDAAPIEVVMDTGDTGQVDVSASVRLRLGDDAQAQFNLSLGADIPTYLLEADLVCERGTMRLFNLFGPHLGARLVLEQDGARTEETLTSVSSYFYQLNAFAAVVRGRKPDPADLSSSLRTMRLIDSIYVHGGLPLRGRPPSAGQP